MAHLKYKGEVLDVPAGYSVLDTLLEHGQEVPNNCRVGACQSCIMQVTKGKVPERAQKGLKDSHKANGLFLACSCQPEEDIDICLPDSEQLRTPASVSHIRKLADDVVELKIKTAEPFEYHAGQYVTLWRDEHLGRCYSLASLMQSDENLLFHIKLIPGGQFSHWVHNDLSIGDTLYVQSPVGDCFYTHGNAEQNLLLAGTGTGLAPLYGIMRDALQSGHTGEIHLFHGALTFSGLYFHDKLSSLEQQHANFQYHPCVLNPSVLNPGILNTETTIQGNIIEGDISKIVLEAIPKPQGWKTFLCGDPELVNKLRKQIFLAGCNMKDIYADAFVYS